MPWSKKVGHFTFFTLERLSYVYFAKKWPKFPIIYLAKLLILTNGLINTNAAGLIVCINSKAIPVPIDLPIIIILSYLNPSFSIIYWYKILASYFIRTEEVLPLWILYPGYYIAIIFI